MAMDSTSCTFNVYLVRGTEKVRVCVISYRVNLVEIIASNEEEDV
jgi:hypothetical protein